MRHRKNSGEGKSNLRKNAISTPSQPKSYWIQNIWQRSPMKHTGQDWWKKNSKWRKRLNWQINIHTKKKQKEHNTRGFDYNKRSIWLQQSIWSKKNRYKEWKTSVPDQKQNSPETDHADFATFAPIWVELQQLRETGTLSKGMPTEAKQQPNSVKTYRRRDKSIKWTPQWIGWKYTHHRRNIEHGRKTETLHGKNKN